MIKSCYIHIPFCENICSYCDFCKLLKTDSLVEKYLKKLEEEIKTTYQMETLDTIYIGGGTPSCLTPLQLERLFQILEVLKKSSSIEYTIEGNFESTTKEKLELYKKYGVNRLSFGMESSQNSILQFLERNLDKEQVTQVLSDAREVGFQNINIDLMYAIPKESMEDLKEDISYLLSLKPEHISTYSLILEKNTKLAIKQVTPISEDFDFKMYEEIIKQMRENNYKHYEISNFAKEGYESKHNTTYWNNEEYYGFGLGASSYLKDKRIENTRSMNQYWMGNYKRREEVLTEQEKIEYEVMLNLRKKEGINLEIFHKKYQKELKDCYDYQELIEEKFLKQEKNHLFIPENKWYISNEIIVKLWEKEI